MASPDSAITSLNNFDTEDECERFAEIFSYCVKHPKVAGAVLRCLSALGVADTTAVSTVYASASKIPPTPAPAADASAHGKRTSAEKKELKKTSLRKVAAGQRGVTHNRFNPTAVIRMVIKYFNSTIEDVSNDFINAIFRECHPNTHGNWASPIDVKRVLAGDSIAETARWFADFKVENQTTKDNDTSPESKRDFKTSRASLLVAHFCLHVINEAASKYDDFHTYIRVCFKNALKRLEKHGMDVDMEYPDSTTVFSMVAPGFHGLTIEGVFTRVLLQKSFDNVCGGHIIDSGEFVSPIEILQDEYRRDTEVFALGNNLLDFENLFGNLMPETWCSPMSTCFSLLFVHWLTHKKISAPFSVFATNFDDFRTNFWSTPELFTINDMINTVKNDSPPPEISYSEALEEDAAKTTGKRVADSEINEGAPPAKKSNATVIDPVESSLDGSDDETAPNPRKRSADDDLGNTDQSPTSKKVRVDDTPSDVALDTVKVTPERKRKRTLRSRH